MKKYRIAAGLSQEALADKARISFVTVGSLERGARRGPFRETVALLGVALGLSDVQLAQFERAARAARGRFRRRSDTIDVKNNLPITLTTFIGRDTDIEEIVSLFDAHRLVTVCGPGGVGKTRIAFEIARAMMLSTRLESWFVDLAPLRDSLYIIDRIASAAEPPIFDPRNSVEILATGIGSRRMLLILDNCEQLVQELGKIVRYLLHACPSIYILATSRERLRITGEATYRLPPLPLPLPNTKPVNPDAARSFGAIELFVQRANAVDSTFEFTADRIAVVAEICERLDGLPLAIELAAARLPMLGLAMLRDRLQERFVLSGGNADAPERQQTLDDTIAWSYNLLTKNEQRLLRRLTAFSGSNTLEAAEIVCAAPDLNVALVIEIISALVDKSLVSVSSVGDGIRYSLSESVWQFARQKLTEGEVESVSRRHAQWLAGLADVAEREYYTLARDAWLLEFAAECDNIHAALEWTLSSPVAEDSAVGGRILGGLRALWTMRGQFAEGRRWAELALERAEEDSRPDVVAKLLSTLIASTTGASAFSASKRAVPLFARVDRRGLAVLQANLISDYTRRGQLEEAQRSANAAHSLLTEQNATRTLAFASFLVLRAPLHCAHGRFERARLDIEAALDLGREFGDDEFLLWCLSRLAEVEYSAGDVLRALELAREVTAVYGTRLAGNAAAVEAFLVLASFYLESRQLPAAREAARTALLHAGTFHGLVYMAIQHLATIAAIDGDPIVAARLLGFVEMWRIAQDYWRSASERGGYRIAAEALAERLTDTDLAKHRDAGSGLTLRSAIDEASSI